MQYWQTTHAAAAVSYIGARRCRDLQYVGFAYGGRSLQSVGGGFDIDFATDATLSVVGKCGHMERLSKLEKDIADQNEMIRYLLHLMEMHYNQNHDNRNIYFRSPVDSLSYKRQEHTLDNSAEPSSREAEIDRYNSSLLTDPKGRLTFNYYWRVHHVLEMPENVTVRSQSFYVSSGSYRMYLTYQPGTFLHMAGIGLTRGERDAVLLWPFDLTVRLSILAQNGRKVYPRDLSSASVEPAHFARCRSVHWQRPHEGDNPGCFILIYSRDLLHTNGYLHKGTVLLHLSVLLVK